MVLNAADSKASNINREFRKMQILEKYYSSRSKNQHHPRVRTNCGNDSRFYLKNDQNGSLD